MSAAEIGAPLGLRSERAALRAALRRGDALDATRAWERLRVVAESISTRERLAARTARKAVGRAIRDARYRRIQSAMDAFAPAAPVVEAVAARSRLKPIALAVAALAVISLLIGFQVMRPEEDYAPAAAAPAEVVQPTVAPTPNTGGRGRTLETPAPVALVTPAPSAAPEPTAAPTASGPVGTPGPTSAAGAQPGGQAGGVTGGVTGGTVGGTVGGVVGGTGTKTVAPSPTPYILPARPPALAPGADRFMFIVLDQATGAPLGGVCVNYGFPVCGAQDPHTNASGQYWLDLNPGMATSWNFRFFNDGYLTATLNKTYRPGMGTSTTTVFLRHL